MQHFDYSNVYELVPTDYYEVTEIGRKADSSSPCVMPDFYEPLLSTRSYLFQTTSGTNDTPKVFDFYYTNIFSIPLEILKTTDDGSATVNYYFRIRSKAYSFKSLTPMVTLLSRHGQPTVIPTRLQDSLKSGRSISCMK